MDVGTLLNLWSTLHTKTDMADPSDRVSLSKLFLHHLDLLQLDDFKFQLFHMVSDENISNSKHKSQLSPENKIWRCGANMAPKKFQFYVAKAIKRLNNCFVNSNFFVHITIWLKSFSDSEERWH